MEGRRGYGWVGEGDKAPPFELPDTEFKPVSPIKTATKVKQSLRTICRCTVVVEHVGPLPSVQITQIIFTDLHNLYIFPRG